MGMNPERVAEMNELSRRQNLTALPKVVVDEQPMVVGGLQILAWINIVGGVFALLFALMDHSGPVAVIGVSSLTFGTILFGMARAIALLARIEKNTRSKS